MKTLTVAQMRGADRRCIEDIGIPGAVLMNNAGAAVFREIDAGPVGIVCGKGNNGGDGFVIARLALLRGFETRVVFVAPSKATTPDAATFLHAFERLGGTVVRVWDAPRVEQTILSVPKAPAEKQTGVSALPLPSIGEAMQSLASCAVIVDALLGTGVNGEVRGAARAAIEAWPDIRTIAVDVPSGMNADTGEPCGLCVRADTTVTFQFMKRGFLSPVAKPCLGRVVVADIGIPEVCADDEAWRGLMG